MAFALKGTGSATTANSTANNQATLVVTTATTAGAAGDLAVLLYAVDNNATVDGDEGAVTAVADSAGNKWVKAVEFTNGQGTAQTGATCGIWYSNLRIALPIAGTVTLTFSNATSRDVSAASLTYFTKGAGFDATVAATNTLANDAAAAGSLSATTANIPCLRIRAIGSESSTVTALTPTATFAVVTQAVGVIAAATSMGIRGEWVINTGTGTASAPTAGAGAVDNASVYAAFQETLTSGSFDNDSDDTGRIVFRYARNAATTALLAASSGLFMPPMPPAAQATLGVPVIDSGVAPGARTTYYQTRVDPVYVPPAAATAVPQGWQAPLSGPPKTTDAVYSNYDLPSKAATSAPNGWQSELSRPLPAADARIDAYQLPSPPQTTQSWWLQPLSIPAPAALVRQGFDSLPAYVAPAAAVTYPTGIPLYSGGSPPRIRRVYAQTRSDPIYVAPVVVVTTPYGWFADLSRPLPVDRVLDANQPQPFFTAATVSVAWQQALSGAPSTTKAQAGFASVPLNTAQLSVNFTPFGWHGPTSTAASTAKARADFGSAPYVAPYASTLSWQQPLSAAPPVAKATVGFSDVPFNTAQVVASNYTNFYFAPLSAPAPVAKAQTGFSFVPYNTAQVVVSAYTDFYFQPLSVAPRVAKVAYDNWQLPYGGLVAAPSGWQQALSTAPPIAKSQPGFSFVPYNTAQRSVNFTPFGWTQPLSGAPQTAKAQLGLSSVPYNTAQVANNYTNFGWYLALNTGVRPRAAIASQPIFVNISASVPQGWYQALASAPPVAKATVGFSSVQYNTRQLAVNFTPFGWHIPLADAPAVAKAKVEFTFVPYNTAQVFRQYPQGWQQELSIPVPVANTKNEVWLNGWHFTGTLRVATPTNPMRIIIIAAEDRDVSLALDGRTVVIAPEIRSIDIS